MRIPQSRLEAFSAGPIPLPPPVEPRLSLAEEVVLLSLDAPRRVIRHVVRIAGKAHADGPRRYGFHHWAIVTSSFDADIERLAAKGYEEAFSDRLPTGSRVVYMDATRDLPGMIELVEHTAAQEQVYTSMYRAAVGWDGSDAIRRTDR